MTSAGAPEFGMFDQTLMLVSVASEPVPEGKGILRIFITSMKDSSQQDIVDISLTPPPRTVKDGMEQSDRFTYRTAARENPEEARCLLMEQQLSLRDVLGVLRRRAWIVLVVVFVAVVLAALLSYVILPPVYRADTSLIINERQNAAKPVDGVDYGQIQTYRSLAITYAKIITSRAVLQDTIDTLKLPETVKQLTGMTTVQVQGETEIIAVTVKDKDATRAALIANTVARSFITQMPTLVNRVENVSVIDRAVPVTEQVSPRPLLNIAVALMVALMLGGLLAFLVDYFDDTVKTPDDIKKLFGLRVLAVVPDMNAKGVRHGRAY